MSKRRGLGIEMPRSGVSLEDALHFIEISTVEKLKDMSEVDRQYFEHCLNDDEINIFYYKKNLKIFGKIETLEDSLKIVRDSSTEELKQMTRDEMIYLTIHFNLDDRLEFMFKRNLKIHDGINNYVKSFLRQITPEVLNEMTRDARVGVYHTLTKMLETPGLTKTNKDNLNSILNGATGPAAGGGKRGKTKKRSRASSK
jgi:hypothetical protein